MSLTGSRRDDDGLLAGLVQVLQNAQHGVGHTIDIGEEGFSHDRNTHATIMAHLLKFMVKPAENLG